MSLILHTICTFIVYHGNMGKMKKVTVEKEGGGKLTNVLDFPKYQLITMSWLIYERRSAL